MTLAADLLRVRDLLAGADDPAAARVATAIDRLFTGEVASLDEAIGGPPAPGRNSLGTTLRIAERDRCLRECAARFNLSAGDLDERLRRFEASAWVRYRVATDCPSQLAGRAEELLWRALKAWPRAPGERHLRSILGRK